VLFQYNTSVGIYHCPADKSTVEDASRRPTTQLRNRSYNMSQSVNGYLQYLASLHMPGLSDLPCWEKFTQIRNPAPSRLFVFIDEHADTLFDAQFGNPAGGSYWPPMWFDMPSDRHSQGACMSFTDGHTERWRWKVPMTFNYLFQTVPAEQIPDFQLVQKAMKLWSDN
jgi:hypothetical protein